MPSRSPSISDTPHRSWWKKASAAEASEKYCPQGRDDGVWPPTSIFRGNTNKLRRPGLRTSLIVRDKLISDKAADRWPVTALGKGRNVKEDPRTPSVWRDEAEAAIIFPITDAALVTHD
jgi:hypothetical protein